MSITRINRELGLLVWLRADSRCEYCGMPQQFDDLTFEIDHVVAEQHGGKTTPANLALACFSCNRRKGSNLAGIDPETGRRTWLFNPRRHKWPRHFRWDGPWLVGRTALGRATISTLGVNAPLRVRLRSELIANGEFSENE